MSNSDTGKNTAETSFVQDKHIPVISVIIPVYNCGEMFIKCLKSVQKQTFSDFEVLMIENGSTDGSDKIAEDFSKSDDRFILIRHHQGKAGECRNVGIKHSKGTYISFIDGDDRVKPDFLENLYDAVIDTESDIAVCGYSYYFPKKGRKGKVRPTISQPSDNKVYTRGQALYLLLADKPMRFFLWNKLWKKELFTEHNITIPDMYYEDAVTCPKLFYYANKVITLEDNSYLYTRAKSRYKEVNMSAQRINDYINTIPMIRLFLEEKDCYEIFKKPFQTHIRHVFLSVPLLVLQTSKQNQDGIFANIKRAESKIKYCLTCTKEELKSLDLTEQTVK